MKEEQIVHTFLPVKEDNLCHTVYYIRDVLRTYMNMDGFHIYRYISTDSPRRYFFCIEPKILITINRGEKKLDDEILSVVREYGFIVTDYGIITGYDESKHIRYKHLLTGKDLGLL